MLTAQMIYEARERIAPYIVKTPLLRAWNLDRFLGCQVYLKLENMQNTVGVFKLRGALNKILSCPAEMLKNGVVAVSSGNHGKATAFVARMLGIPATVVVPDTAPPVKVDAIRAMGAEVVFSSVAERFAVGEQLAREKGVPLIPPFNDELIMAGQGTAGLEIAEQQPDLDVVIVPLSGGGLIAGVSEALRAAAPQMRVWGAEPAVLPRFTESKKAGKAVNVGTARTVADGLVASMMGEKCFSVDVRNVELAGDVSEEYILKGMKLLLLEGKILAEASAAIGIGGVMEGVFPIRKDQKVCFFISGGSVGLDQLEKLKTVRY